MCVVVVMSKYHASTVMPGMSIGKPSSRFTEIIWYTMADICVFSLYVYREHLSCIAKLVTGIRSFILVLCGKYNDFIRTQ